VPGPLSFSPYFVGALDLVGGPEPAATKIRRADYFSLNFVGESPIGYVAHQANLCIFSPLVPRRQPQFFITSQPANVVVDLASFGPALVFR
jgi:hypothetical protein